MQIFKVVASLVFELQRKNRGGGGGGENNPPAVRVLKTRLIEIQYFLKHRYQKLTHIEVHMNTVIKDEHVNVRTMTMHILRTINILNLSFSWLCAHIADIVLFQVTFSVRKIDGAWAS